MIITSLNDKFTVSDIRWDVHTVAQSTTCTICTLKLRFKHCQVVSRPPQLSTTEKLRVSHGMVVLISNGGIWQIIQCGVDYAIVNKVVEHLLSRQRFWLGVHV